MNINNSKERLEKTLSNIGDFLFKCLSSFFSPDLEQKHPLIRASWILIFYGFGIFLWFMIFNGWSNNIDFHDWADISVPRIAFIQQALINAQFPLHV
jgi:hypothetical protein